MLVQNSDKNKDKAELWVGGKPRNMEQCHILAANLLKRLIVRPTFWFQAHCFLKVLLDTYQLSIDINIIFIFISLTLYYFY